MSSMSHDKAVRVVSAYFKDLGYQILKPPRSKNSQGTDLTVVGKRSALRVEVKPARCVKGTCWQVRGVESGRLQDDILAIVFPNGRVHLEDMGQWVQSMAKDGSRGITALGRIYNGQL